MSLYYPIVFYIISWHGKRCAALWGNRYFDHSASYHVQGLNKNLIHEKIHRYTRRFSKGFHI